MRGRRAFGAGSLRKVGEAWRLQWRTEHGQVRRKQLGRDRRVAERIRAEIIRSRDLALAGLGHEVGQELPLSELLRDYLADLRHRVVVRHFEGVMSRLRVVLEELGDVRVCELRTGAVVSMRSTMLARGASHRTANLHADCLGALLRWAEQSGRIGKSPLANLRRLPETRDHQRYRRRALSEAEIRRFLAASAEDDERCAELAAAEGSSRVPQTPFWRALLETGARFGELRLATWGDLDLRDASLLLRAETTKSRKARAIPIGSGLLQLLRDLRAVQTQVQGRLPSAADPIFLSPDGQAWKPYTKNVMRVLDRVLAAAGIPKVDARGEKLDIHALRTTANTRLARAGVEVSTRQRLLGHSDPRLTANTYTRLDLGDLRAAIERLPEVGDAPAQNHIARAEGE